MKIWIEVLKENWEKVLIIIGALIIFCWVIPVKYFNLQVKDAAIQSVSNNGLIFKGDTIIVSNLSNVVFYPEDRDSLKILFNRADKLTSYIYKHKYRIGDYKTLLGKLHDGRLIVSYHYNSDIFDIVTLNFEENNMYFGSIRQVYRDKADRFIYILTKYKKYQDDAYNEEKKDKAKLDKILNGLKRL